MLAALADTHTLIWYLYADSRLSAPAKSAIDAAATAGDQIALSSITLIEMVYLIEKGRIAAESFTRLAMALEDSDALFVAYPPDLQVARALAQIDLSVVPDMPDRIIAATAHYLRVPLISRVRKISVSGVTTIW